MTTRAIRNIYCVGRNYREHAAELGNAVPEAPMLFMKPSHAAAAMDGSAITLPAGHGAIHYEAEVVLHVGRDYREGLTVDELVDRFALGLDMTLREVQDTLKKKGQPWLAAKGFRGSAPLGPFRPFPGAAAIRDTSFALKRNGEEVQRGTTGMMIFDLQTIVDYCAMHYGLGEGDLIFTGTPAGVGAVADGDRFELLWDGEEAGSCRFALV
ncbi:fumarylacetoacetate hydrolase family protein [Paenibacillus cymbidii]|uniref:fumarylacetoacetate hydrolase family protein n=1 Tax=Paenibacillus cymbidii TaxID=1639034 RepID=UPI0010819DEB|nr:fumarylacetoacetate hydrolase family protein [Paenibacillus cymbidii]